MKLFFSPLLLISIAAIPAFASVSITSPSSGDHVPSPFTLSATSTSCSSQGGTYAQSHCVWGARVRMGQGNDDAVPDRFAEYLDDHRVSG